MVTEGGAACHREPLLSIQHGTYQTVKAGPFFQEKVFKLFLVVPSVLDGRVDPSFRALSGRRNFTVRRHKCNKASRSGVAGANCGVVTDGGGRVVRHVIAGLSVQTSNPIGPKWRGVTPPCALQTTRP